MAILKVARMGHPVLNMTADAVEDPTAPEIQRLIADMVDTMADAPGIGLAAPQVHVPKRLVIFHIPETRAHQEEDENGDEAEEAVPMTVLINPEIVARSEETSVYEEGCLSIPEYTEDVERPARVTVRYLDREGAERTVDADGLLATCLQHEIDHLNGVLFVDYLSRLKRERVLKKFAKQAKLGA